MENYLLPAVVGVLLILLVVFVIWRNNIDRKNLEENLNQDYRKPQKHGNDVEEAEDRTA